MLTFHTVTLLSYFALWKNLFTHAWFFNIMYWLFGKYWFIELMQIFQMPYSIIQYFKNHINITSNFIIQAFNYWEAVKLTVENKVFQNQLSLESLSFYHWQQILSIVSFEAISSLNSFWENVCQIPKSEWLVYLSVIPSTWNRCVIRKATNLAHNKNNCTNAFPGDDNRTSVSHRNSHCIT